MYCRRALYPALCAPGCCSFYQTPSKHNLQSNQYTDFKELFVKTIEWIIEHSTVLHTSMKHGKSIPIMIRTTVNSS